MKEKDKYIDMKPDEIVSMASCLVDYFTENPSEIEGNPWLERILKKARTFSAENLESPLNSSFRIKLEQFNSIYRCARC